MLNLQNFNELNIEAEFDDAVFEENTSYSGFPLHVLPNEAQEFIREAQKRGLNPDLLAASMLGTVSGALGSNFSISTFQQKPGLWIVLVAPSGVGKTPVLSLATAPLIERDKELRQMQPKTLAEYQGNKPRKNDPMYSDALIINDFTPEIFRIRLQIRPRGVIIIRNELSEMFNQFGRYNANGGEAQIMIGLWDGGSHLSIDRVSGSFLIKNPYLPMLGTTQPSETYQVYKNNRGNNGFSHRVLFVYLPTLKKPEANLVPMPPQLTQSWSSAVNRLLNLPNSQEYNLDLTPQAHQAYRNYYNHNVERINDEHNETLKSLYSKYDLHVLRLATVLHALKWGYGVEEDFGLQIGEDTVDHAVEVANFFLYNTLQLMSDVGTYQQPEKLDMLYNSLPEGNFSTAQAKSIAGGLGIKSRDVDRFLAKGEYCIKLAHGVYKKSRNG